MDEKDKKVARLEELLQSIKDNIDETESVLDSLSNSELQAENDNDLPDDEFDLFTRRVYSKSIIRRGDGR